MRPAGWLGEPVTSQTGKHKFGRMLDVHQVAGGNIQWVGPLFGSQDCANDVPIFVDQIGVIAVSRAYLIMFTIQPGFGHADCWTLQPKPHV